VTRGGKERSDAARITAHAAVVVGASAGGLESLLAILAPLPADFPLPVLVAQHLHRTDEGRFAEHLASRVAIAVTEAHDKQPIEPAHVYVAPADYHLLVERGGTLALTVDPRVNWSRPSIDVLFESAARAFGDALVGVILSGANDDGARGMQLIRELGGLCVAQDPQTAESPVMPRAAIELAGIETVLPPERIGRLLRELAIHDYKERG
jgi:two-component system chemotaxis response regulator CheB